MVKRGNCDFKHILLIHLARSESVFASSPYVQLSTCPQLGLLYLASKLREAGYNPEYLDSALKGVNEKSIENLVSGKDFLFIGFYSNIAFCAGT